MKAPILTYEELKKSKKYVGEISYNGFVQQITRSKLAGELTQEQIKDLLN